MLTVRADKYGFVIAKIGRATTYKITQIAKNYIIFESLRKIQTRVQDGLQKHISILGEVSVAWSLRLSLLVICKHSAGVQINM
jgi:hypothetical protein